MARETRVTAERDRGAVMVELALVLPLLLMLLIGIAEFGQAYNAKISIQSAAREGARCLALKERDCSATQAVNDSGIAADIVSISKSPCPASASATSTAYATVSVTARYTFNIPFLSLGTRTFDATSSMRCGL